MTSLGIIEMRSPLKGLKLVAEVQAGGELEPVMIRADDPKYFIVIFRGRRDELITVLDAVFPAGGHYYIKKTYIPSPHPELLNFLEPKEADRIVEHLGIVETVGYGIMVKCIDMVLKTPGLAVVNTVFDTVSGNGMLYITGGDAIFSSLFMEMKGICGCLDIRNTAVISSPGKMILGAIS
ncbi:MAG: hypothetical protein QGH39_13020 [Candidatus Thermoplasmatota archaeon]|nr:hypothetical protein [Candidatus Thermoplasmatota archaeon]MDP7266470.1 hypothetical protein [Candidatus Thermoplasmatota archaeon]